MRFCTSEDPILLRRRSPCQKHVQLAGGVGRTSFLARRSPCRGHCAFGADHDRRVTRSARVS